MPLLQTMPTVYKGEVIANDDFRITVIPPSATLIPVCEVSRRCEKLRIQYAQIVFANTLGKRPFLDLFSPM